MKKSLSRFSSTLALIAPTAALLASNADAALFIKFDGIDGEASAAKGHEKWIELQSWSWGATQTGSASTGGGAGKVSMQDFHFVHYIDKSSPLLFLRCATGQVSPTTVTLSFTRTLPSGAEVEYYTITLTNVMISSVKCDKPVTVAGQSSGDDRPMESISLYFLKIEMKYQPYDDVSGAPGTPVSSGVVEIQQAAGTP